MIPEIETEKDLFRAINDLAPFVGNTPLFPIRKVDILAKLEWQQFGGSVKTRPAWNIIRNAVERGDLTKEKTLIDASSGNTAIAYASIGASIGLPVCICLPENASEERKRILKALDAEVILTPATGEMDEAQDKARSIAEAHPGRYYYADQYNNEANWKAHYETTGEELLAETGGRITHFVSGLGTTGTFMGTARRLKEDHPEVCTVSLQPDLPLHGMEGWKHMETVRNPSIYEKKWIDEESVVGTEEALEMVGKLAREEGLFVSPSSGANLAGAIKVAQELDRGTVVTVFPDNGDKYGDILKKIL